MTKTLKQLMVLALKREAEAEGPKEYSRQVSVLEGLLQAAGILKPGEPLPYIRTPKPAVAFFGYDILLAYEEVESYCSCIERLDRNYIVSDV